jgi:hypothetical protein
MSRRFYLPPHKPVRTAARPKLSLRTLPLWVKVAVPATLFLAVAIIGLDVLGIWPRRAAPGTRYQADSAVPRDTTTQPTDTGVRLTDEGSADVASETPAASDVALYEIRRPIRLQVLNGCGVKGLAKVVAPALRAKGFDVRETRNAGSFRYAYTSVMDRVGRRELAQAVADSLGIDRSRVTTEIARNLVDIDVTVIVGADYENLRLGLGR